MKLGIVFPVCIVLASALSGLAQADSYRSMPEGMMHDKKVESAGMAAHGWTDGVVRKVAKDTGKVTIAHGPLENLGMPGMTMVFRVLDAAWLERMKPGERIRFQAERIGGVFTVVKFDPIE